MSYKLLFLCILLLSACSNGVQSETASKAKTPPSKPAENIVLASKNSEVSPLKRGAKVFRYCKACHTLDESGRHKVGPNLWGIYGRAAGAREDFKYSKAIRASGVIWTEETMDAYLTKPSAFIKGGLMSFAGVKKQEDRDALQLYLKAKTTPAEPE